MLRIEIPEIRAFDDKTSTFITLKPQTLDLEHSLISISKWEMKWKKPFLDREHQKTAAEAMDYIRCMTINSVDPIVYSCLTQKDMDKINDYIEDPMTATKIRDTKKNAAPSRKVITNEVIYYWMGTLGIEKSYEKWHLNRLLTLIQVYSEMNTPKKKMRAGDIMRQNSALNAQRRRMLGTSG